MVIKQFRELRGESVIGDQSASSMSKCGPGLKSAVIRVDVLEDLNRFDRINGSLISWPAIP